MTPDESTKDAEVTEAAPGANVVENTKYRGKSLANQFEKAWLRPNFQTETYTRETCLSRLDKFKQNKLKPLRSSVSPKLVFDPGQIYQFLKSHELVNYVQSIFFFGSFVLPKKKPGFLGFEQYQPANNINVVVLTESLLDRGLMQSEPCRYIFDLKAEVWEPDPANNRLLKAMYFCPKGLDVFLVNSITFDSALEHRNPIAVTMLREGLPYAGRFPFPSYYISNENPNTISDAGAYEALVFHH